MRRFFFKVEEAVNLVETAVARADELHGQIIGRRMKAALIRDILDVWVKHRGGEWRQIEGRPGERNDEYLIGDIELPFAREVEFDGVSHYIISPKQRQARPLAHGLSSANAERLLPAELAEMIMNPPAEGSYQ